ncbi:hypothetical protein pb186bvf_003381 [Paramecium bursaria]
MKQFLVWGQEKSGKVIIIVLSQTSLIQRWKTSSSQNQSSKGQTLSKTNTITFNREEIQLVESESNNGSLMNFQTKNIKGIFLVFDLTNPKSSLELVSLSQELKDRIKILVPIIFLGNKFDLKDQSSTSQLQLKQMAEKLNAPYYFVCATTGSQCDQALDRMIELSKSFQPSKDQNPITNGRGQHKGCCQIF